MVGVIGLLGLLSKDLLQVDGGSGCSSLIITLMCVALRW